MTVVLSSQILLFINQWSQLICVTFFARYLLPAVLCLDWQ